MIGFMVARPFAGVELIESLDAVKRVEDWSACRSEARAKRRHAMGHKTRMVIRLVPQVFSYDGGRTIIIHPEAMKALCSASAQVAQKIEKKLDLETWRIFRGGGILNPDIGV